MNRITSALGLLAGLTLATIGSAQAQVSLEFISGFGQQSPYIQTFPPNQVPPEGFSRPTGLDFLSADRILVADYGNNKLQNCKITGEDCQWLGGDGGFGRNEPGTYDRPHGVQVRDSDGKYAIADEDNHAVQLCTAVTCVYRGDSTTTDNDPSSGLGRWAFPNDVAFDREGRVYGLDTGNNRIQILGVDDLRVLDTFMQGGSSLGQIEGARGIAVDDQGLVIIADTGNHRIQLCDTNENCTAFGGQGSGPGQFNGPVGVEVDALGRIWVADTGNNRIQACTHDGDCTVFGSGDGFTFNEPHDVAVHPNGMVAVANTTSNQILFFRTEAAGFAFNAGYNDAWFDPNTAGQGFFINVFPDQGSLFVANFTFDTERPPGDVTAILGEPGHRWLTAQGPYNGGTATLSVTLTQGGVFDSSQPAVENVLDYGSYTLEALGCDSILLTYDLPAIPRQRTIELERVVKDNVAVCEALNGP